VIGVAGSWVRLSVLTAWVIAQAPATARAAGTAERTFSVAYDAPSFCPGRERFLEAVRARAPEATLRDGDADLAFAVRVAPEGTLASGIFTVRFRKGEHFAREVPASPCDDVITSMAIMAGLLLSGALLPEPPPSPEAEPIEPARPPEPPRAPAPPAEPAPPVRATEAPRTAPASPLRVRAGLFVDGRLDFAAAPFPAFGVAAGLDGLLERESWFSPGARIGFLYVTGDATAPPLGGAHFALRALTLRGCPLRVALGASWSLAACGLFEGGVLTASPRDTVGSNGDSKMSWLGFGAAGRVEAPLIERLAVEAEASAFGLVHHDRFVLQPGDVNVHTVPAFSGAISLGLVARWP